MKLQVGDIFRVRGFLSHRPCWNVRHPGSKVVRTNAITFGLHSTISWDEIQRRPGGWTRKVRREEDFRVTEDLSDHLWVVVRAEMEGGGHGHGAHDVYPDGWHVTARHANESGEAQSETMLEFYQSGCFITILPYGAVEVVGRANTIPVTRPERRGS